MVAMGQLLARSYNDFEGKMSLLSNNSRVERWTPPNEGWVKLNVDGAVALDGQQASIRGLLQDSTGTWLWGYAMSYGGDSVFKVEARVMLEGLLLVWDKGFKRVEVESDNALLVELLQSGEDLVAIW